GVGRLSSRSVGGLAARALLLLEPPLDAEQHPEGPHEVPVDLPAVLAGERRVAVGLKDVAGVIQRRLVQSEADDVSGLAHARNFARSRPLPCDGAAVGSVSSPLPALARRSLLPRSPTLPL